MLAWIELNQADNYVPSSGSHWTKWQAALVTHHIEYVSRCTAAQLHADTLLAMLLHAVL